MSQSQLIGIVYVLISCIPVHRLTVIPFEYSFESNSRHRSDIFTEYSFNRPKNTSIILIVLIYHDLRAFSMFVSFIRSLARHIVIRHNFFGEFNTQKMWINGITSWQKFMCSNDRSHHQNVYFCLLKLIFNRVLDRLLSLPCMWCKHSAPKYRMVFLLLHKKNRKPIINW